MNKTFFLTLPASAALLLGGCVENFHLEPSDGPQILEPDLSPDEEGADFASQANPRDLAFTGSEPEGKSDWTEQVGTFTEPSGDPEVPVPELDWDLAVLTSGGDIVLFDDAGTELDSISTGLYWPTHMDWHDDGFFIVGDSYGLHRVEASGLVSPFTSHPFAWNWNVGVTDTGDVVVPDEYEMGQLDEDGYLLMSSPMNSADCYMDVAFAAGETYTLNVYGPSVDRWDTASNSITPVMTGLPWGMDYLAVDGNGAFWVSEAWGTELWTEVGNGNATTAAPVGSLMDMGISATGITGLATAAGANVYVVYTGTQNDGVALVSRSGTAQILVEANSEVWVDVAVP